MCANDTCRLPNLSTISDGWVPLGGSLTPTLHTHNLHRSIKGVPVVSNDQLAGVDSLGEGWLTIAEAAKALEVSAKTIRRRLKAGEITGELVHDPKIGAERWMIDAEALPTAPGAALIPVELLDRLEDAWRQARESAAEAAIAEQRVDFEKDRRQRAEAEAKTAKLERDRFAVRVEELRRSLRAEQRRRWWQRRRSRGELRDSLKAEQHGRWWDEPNLPTRGKDESS